MKLNEVKNNKEEYKIYCDMDGVLVDFFAGIKQLIPEYTEERYETDKKFSQHCWNTLKEITKKGDLFWYNLPPMPDMEDLWGVIGKYKSTEILTATGIWAPESVANQKTEWIRDHIGNDIIVNTVQKARDKAEYAEPNFILIDDKRKAIDPWIAAGGIGVLHNSAAETIRQLKELGL